MYLFKHENVVYPVKSFNRLKFNYAQINNPSFLKENNNDWQLNVWEKLVHCKFN